MPPVPTRDDDAVMPKPFVPTGELPQWSTTDATVATLVQRLRRSLVEESVYDDLESVLGEHVAPTAGDAAKLIERFRGVVGPLVQIVPHLVTPYPTAEMQRVTQLGSVSPAAQDVRGHLNLFALAVLDVLDLMGDDAP